MCGRSQACNTFFFHNSHGQGRMSCTHSFRACQAHIEDVATNLPQRRFGRSSKFNPGGGFSVLFALFAGLQPRSVLEIGLGCGPTGPGESVRVWKGIWPRAKLHIGEFDQKCAAHWAKKHPDVDVLVGDQGNETSLRSWASRGPFDFIIDDGSHFHSHILLSLKTLWPHLAPGGVYFIEDLAAELVDARFRDSFGMSAPGMLGSWLTDVIYGVQKPLADLEGMWCQFNGCALLKLPAA